ncbi:hypothetical protein [Lactobacillus sp. ESL0225]|nr:hypothetical protein [Lactobacillus sp. ESL0225]
MQEHRMVLDIDSDVHLHVYDLAGQEVKDLILFGDWLKKIRPIG